MRRYVVVASLVLIALITPIAVTMESVYATGDFWTTLTPMPEAMSGCKAAAVNGRIYVFAQSITYEYNPTSDHWTTKTSMPTPRSSFALAAYQNKIYVIGGKIGWSGEIGSVMTGKNEAYDPTTDTWETMASMPIPTMSCEANTANGFVYVMGGLKDPLKGDASEISQAYNPVNNTWSLKNSMPTAVFNYASAVIDNKIYVMGGEGRDTSGNLNQIYDTETDSWASGKNMSGPTNGAGAVATTGLSAPKRIYVIGGRLGYNYDVSDANQIYDPEQDSWTKGATMRNQRRSLAVAVVDDRIYAIGGSYPEYQTTKSGAQASGTKLTLVSNTKITPTNFFPYEDCADNERYTPTGFGENHPSTSPTVQPTTAPPSLTPTLNPTSSPTPTTSASPESAPSPSNLNQQTPTAKPPESGSDDLFKTFDLIWIALTVIVLAAITVAAVLAKRAAKNRKSRVP